MANLSDTFDKAQKLVSEIKDISQSNNETVQGVNSMDNSVDISNSSEDMVSVPIISKSMTNILLWIAVGSTILFSVLGGICMIVFDKDITSVLMQLIGYNLPVTLGCLTKKGVENVAITKYLNKEGK